MASAAHKADAQAIRTLIEAWPIWRDSGDWDRVAAAWHSDGTMSSTRYHGSAADFVLQTRAAFERGAEVRHLQGGFWCKVRGDRAYSITGMEIRQRAIVHGVEVDASCLGRFVDLLERRNGEWRIVRRQPIYDRDRIDPVTPGERVELDADLLASFPRAYRHLAYIQHQQGHTINRDLPEARSAEHDELMRQAREWVA